MIAFLRGRVLEKHPNRLIVDVAGVGYDVAVPLSTFYTAGEAGAEISLRVHTHVREDQLALYGFASALELTVFERMIAVSGIGPKLALSVLSGIEPREFVVAIQHADLGRLTRIPGVGKKTAERLLVELKDRFKAWETVPAMFALVPNQPGGPDAPPVATAENDAVSALISLGYKPQEASKAISAIKEKGLSSEDMIRRALKGMI